MTKVYCDGCGGEIASLEDSWVEWWNAPNEEGNFTEGTTTGWRLIHTYNASGAREGPNPCSDYAPRHIQRAAKGCVLQDNFGARVAETILEAERCVDGTIESVKQRLAILVLRDNRRENS